MSENIIENNNETRPFTWWERLKYVFTDPNKAFENLAEYPKILFPMLTISIGLIILMVFRLDLFKEVFMEQMVQQFNAMGREIPPNLEVLATTQAYTTMIITGVMPIIVWLIKAALVNGVANLADGDGTFKQGLSVITYAYFPVLLGSIIITIISLIVGDYNITASLSVLLPESMKSGFLYNFLLQLDIFVIWYEILAIIGISRAYDISKKRAAVAVLGTWIAWILVISGIGAVTSALTGGM